MNGMTHPLFRDRTHAGAILAEELKAFVDPQFLILALPRGGVLVAAEVARRLDLELDVLVFRKLSVPRQEELTIGAAGTGGVHVVYQGLAQLMGVDDRQCGALIAEAELLVQRRHRQYRGDAPAPSFFCRSVCLIDDGLPTGSTMAAAIEVVRRHYPSRIIAAVPVSPPEICAAFQRRVDLRAFVCPHQPQQFSSVGMWYEDFSEVTDEQACALLRETSQARVRPEGSVSI